MDDYLRNEGVLDAREKLRNVTKGPLKGNYFNDFLKQLKDRLVWLRSEIPTKAIQKLRIEHSITQPVVKNAIADKLESAIAKFENKHDELYSEGLDWTDFFGLTGTEKAARALLEKRVSTPSHSSVSVEEDVMSIFIKELEDAFLLSLVLQSNDKSAVDTLFDVRKRQYVDKADKYSESSKAKRLGRKYIIDCSIRDAKFDKTPTPSDAFNDRLITALWDQFTKAVDEEYPRKIKKGKPGSKEEFNKEIQRILEELATRTGLPLPAKMRGIR